MGHRIAQDGLLSTHFTYLSHSRHSPLGQSRRQGAKPPIYRPAGDARGLGGKVRNGGGIASESSEVGSSERADTGRPVQVQPSTHVVRSCFGGRPGILYTSQAPFEGQPLSQASPIFQRFFNDSSDYVGRALASLPLAACCRVGCRALLGRLGRSADARAERSAHHAGGQLAGESAASHSSPAGQCDFRAVPEEFLEGVGPDEGLLLPVRRRRVHAAQGRVVRCDPQGRHQLRLHGVSHVLAAGGRAGEDGRRVAGHAARFHGRRADGDRPRHGPISPRRVRGPRPLAETDQVRPAGAEGDQEGRCRGQDKPAEGRRERKVPKDKTECPVRSIAS